MHPEEVGKIMYFQFSTAVLVNCTQSQLLYTWFCSGRNEPPQRGAAPPRPGGPPGMPQGNWYIAN